MREAIINAVLHSDYSTMRSCIQVAIFDDRMEITNPGPLPLGLSLETALSGVSQLRNRVLGRICGMFVLQQEALHLNLKNSISFLE